MSVRDNGRNSLFGLWMEVKHTSRIIVRSNIPHEPHVAPRRGPGIDPRWSDGSAKRASAGFVISAYNLRKASSLGFRLSSVVSKQMIL
jgi:hypothetical protein